MRKTILVFVVFVTTVTTVQAGETFSGPAKIINGTTMMIADKTLTLAHIKTVMPGTSCIWKNRPLDCGVLARAGLQDLVVGSDVSCRKAKIATGYVCRAGGFDLAFGLIHAGWAVPTKTAPKYYFSRAERAKNNGLALWSAKDNQGQIIAAGLK